MTFDYDREAYSKAKKEGFKKGYEKAREDLRALLEKKKSFDNSMSREPCSICTTTAFDEPRKRIGAGCLCPMCITEVKAAVGLIDVDELLAELEDGKLDGEGK